jgi:CMP-N,N'-diacetyllegionaminic acid synthase
MAVVGLIPTRAGSKRVPGKNIRRLGEHPLLAYTISAARLSSIFDDVVVSTDSEEIAAIARHYGAEVPELRPAAMAEDLSPDIDWVVHTLDVVQRTGREYDAFAILRPTNPFRMPETIRRAWDEFVGEPGIDSLRAVEKCKQHPGKMWVVRERRMMPLLPLQPEEQPWHSSPYQSLPTVYVQTAALELAWTRTVSRTRTIAGTSIMPFFMSPAESLDINDPLDWDRADALLVRGITLPPVTQTPFIS